MYRRITETPKLTTREIAYFAEQALNIAEANEDDAIVNRMHRILADLELDGAQEADIRFLAAYLQF